MLFRGYHPRQQPVRASPHQAYDLAQREGQLRKTLDALKNAIQGYGDAYLLPSSTLLDELEERYGFTDAGAKLKEARERVSSMTKANRAATCDYVEQNRRDTAIRFILDAFNGKVASLLATAKHDNYGTLRQKTLDGYQLVNHHGTAFRNARITAEYVEAQLEARLAELTARLHEAEEKGRRALSMAQQTRSGNVCVISNVGSFGENIFKIGMTRRLEPEERIRELGDASVPFGFDIHAMIRADDAPALETALHKRFMAEQLNKVNPRKEFYRVSIADVRREVEGMGIQTAWTMTAACEEWRETKALEARLAKDRDEYERWQADQLRSHDRILEQVEQAADAST